jgi:hypothetical protein
MKRLSFMPVMVPRGVSERSSVDDPVMDAGPRRHQPTMQPAASITLRGVLAGCPDRTNWMKWPLDGMGHGCKPVVMIDRLVRLLSLVRDSWRFRAPGAGADRVATAFLQARVVARHTSQASQAPIQTIVFPPPSCRDSSRHCQPAPWAASHSVAAVQSRRQIPELREMQLNPSGQSELRAHIGVHVPPGKLPPVIHCSSAQSVLVVHDSPVPALSLPHPMVSRTIARREARIAVLVRI